VDGIKIAPKWYDLIEKNLESGDEIRRTYAGKLNGNGGYLCLSNRKLFFVLEEGFIRKTYNIALNLPYDEIDDVSPESRHNLKIKENKGREHKFVALEVPASIIERSFEELTYIKRAAA